MQFILNCDLSYLLAHFHAVQDLIIHISQCKITICSKLHFDFSLLATLQLAGRSLLTSTILQTYLNT